MTGISQVNVTTQTDNKKQAENKPAPIARFNFAEVDTALAECEKIIKSHSDTVKSKLAGNAAIPGNVLRELSKANALKAKLVMRRIVLLIESGDTVATELIEKLVKMKAPKAG